MYSWWLLQGDSHTLIILEADQEKDLFSSNSAFLFFRWGETISYYELHLWQWLDFFLSLWTMFTRTRPMKSICRIHVICTFLKLFLFLLIIHCNIGSTVLSLLLLQQLQSNSGTIHRELDLIAFVYIIPFLLISLSFTSTFYFVLLLSIAPSVTKDRKVSQNLSVEYKADRVHTALLYPLLHE